MELSEIFPEKNTMVSARPGKARLSRATPERGWRLERGSRESKGLGSRQPSPLGLARGDRELEGGKQPRPVLETLRRPCKGAGH